MENVDVAIIGAGPAGSAAAIVLAERGHRVALIDKQSFPREKLCGDFINPINRPILRRLGVEDEVDSQPHASVSGFRITATSGVVAEGEFPRSAGDSGAGLGLPRALLDHTLLRRAADRGADIRLNSRAEALSRNARGWRFNTGGEAWLAKILIGADGRNSRVAEQLGLSRRTATRGRAVGFQARMQCPGATQDKVEIHLFPGGYAGLVGLGGGELNLCLAVDRRQLPRAGASEFLLQSCLPKNPCLKKVLEQSTAISPFRSAYPVYFSRRRSYAEGALLAGDAARVSEPVTGEGICFAMQSGLLAAEVIAEALAANDSSAGFLRTYEQRCIRAFRGRMSLNALLRFAVYRPALLDPLIGLLARRRGWLDTLIGAVCTPQPLR
jgi:geranylgeranyl reductase family protein